MPTQYGILTDGQIKELEKVQMRTISCLWLSSTCRGKSWTIRITLIEMQTVIWLKSTKYSQISMI